MKRYSVIHQTIYEFSGLAQLQDHTLRLRPREDHDQHIESFELNITPQASLRWHRDVESNSVAIATFLAPTDRLMIESTSVVQKYDVSPHDFLIAEYAVTYPFEYTQDEKTTLQPYLDDGSTTNNEQLDNWISEVWAHDKPMQTFELLLLLNQQIYKSIKYNVREEEGVQSTLYTLSARTGSCRDLASLYIDVVRQLGFAARFVSGYIHTAPSDTLSQSTHAWAEVFIPGAGWKGFDPTQGSLVGGEHIAVAVTRSPDLVPPISGDFWGLPGSHLKVNVWTNDIS
ncbi:transglutaminase family protein [Alteromonas ponticola]|uniref:Transglutaminase family protein n=1 Tax=Alteromonas aquimaris TaxID=2998417 RepID=A0ABT3P3V6_9ALTE|nr:transglutaminase family protein [Alteromonas aquimaris]MCW8107434.1 transglutaminase family protein [Alteromonas aquimaris]